MRTTRPVATFVLLVFAAAMGAAAQTVKRLTAEVIYAHKNDQRSGAMGFDSLGYAYSGLRGSRFDVNSLEYGIVNGHVYQQMFFTGEPYFEMTATNNIDSGYLFNLDYDTVRHDNYTGSFGYVYRTRTGGINAGEYYFAQGNLQIYRAPGQTIHFFNAGYLSRVALVSLSAAGASPDTVMFRDLVYDASGRLMFDSISMYTGAAWMEYSTTRYTYGTAKGYLSMIRNYVEPNLAAYYNKNVANTYYPDGRLKSSGIEKRNAFGSSYIASIDSFGYVPGVSGYTYHSLRNNDTDGSFADMTISICEHANASGQKDSVSIYFGSSPSPLLYSTVSVLYDAAGYPIQRNNYRFDAAGKFLSGYELFYYEQISTTGSNILAVRQTGFSLCPNPTTENPVLSSSDLPAGTPVCLSIVNAAGVLVQRRNFVWEGKQEKVRLADQAPGLYFLSLQDHGGNLLFHQGLIKR